MTRRRDTDRHPANRRRVSNPQATSRGGRRLHSVPDLPHLLPALIGGDDEDPKVDPFEVFDMSLPDATRDWLHENGFSLDDAFEGRVPGVDPDEIVAKAMEETWSHNGPWSPME